LAGKADVKSDAHSCNRGYSSSHFLFHSPALARLFLSRGVTQRDAARDSPLSIETATTFETELVFYEAEGGVAEVSTLNMLTFKPTNAPWQPFSNQLHTVQRQVVGISKAIRQPLPPPTPTQPMIRCFPISCSVTCDCMHAPKRRGHWGEKAYLLAKIVPVRRKVCLFKLALALAPDDRETSGEYS
jgi:hypothetical protein